MNGKWDRVFAKFLEGSPGQWAGFVAAVIAISVAVWWVARYRASLRDDADPAAADAQLALRLRELREGGQVSEAEYRKVRSRLAPPTGQTGPGVPPAGDAAGGRDRHPSPSPGPDTRPAADEDPA